MPRRTESELTLASAHQAQQSPCGVERRAALSMAPFGRIKISVASFAPSTIGALDIFKPSGGTSHRFVFSAYARLFQPHKDRPCAIDVIGSPPSVP